MKKSEAMDLYDGLNGISPKMIEEAGNYKKTASADIGHKKLRCKHKHKPP